MRKFGLLATVCATLVFTHEACAVGPSSETINARPITPTYSQTYAGLTVASAATDILTLTGSASKTITLQDFQCSGTATATGVNLVELVLRSTADSGGTAVTATTVAKHDSNNAAATGAVVAYSANPTLGTSAGVVATGLMTTYVATGAPTAPGIDFNFVYSSISDMRQPVVLRGTAQQVALNLNGGTINSATSLTCTVTWTEN